MTPPPETSSTRSGAAPALPAHQHLLELFAGWTAVFPADFAIVSPQDVPEPFHHLLVHHQHMTEVLQREYDLPVNLTVQWSEASEDTYRRRIILRAGPDGVVTELGAVRLNLSLVPPAVQQEILAQIKPLGRILIDHKVLRRVQPHEYLRFDSQSPVVKLFNLPVPRTLYGRTGTIFCNEQPAIELLEIVTGVTRSAS